MDVILLFAHLEVYNYEIYTFYNHIILFFIKGLIDYIENNEI